MRYAGAAESTVDLAKRGENGVQVFQKAIGQAGPQLARVHGVWGISQMARQDKKRATRLLPLLQDKDAEIRAQAAKWLGDIRYSEAGSALIPMLKDTASRVRFFAAEALGRISYEPAINPIIEFLNANNDIDAYIRHAGTLALARIGKAEPLLALSSHASRALRIAAVVALRRMSDPGIARFLNDSDEFVVTETARAINDDLSIKDALPALGNLLNTTQFTAEALLRRAINANLRVGSTEAMQNLLTYASKEGVPTAMRAEAVEALSTWAKPSVLDRVDGRLRGVIERDPAIVRNSASDAMLQLLNNRDSAVRISAVKAISKLAMKQGAAQLLQLAKSDREADVRVEALKALVALKRQSGKPKQCSSVSMIKKKKVRVAGLNLLQEMNLSKELMGKTSCLMS
jgi:HEAT repeat protein